MAKCSRAETLPSVIFEMRAGGRSRPEAKQAAQTEEHCDLETRGGPRVSMTGVQREKTSQTLLSETMLSFCSGFSFMNTTSARQFSSMTFAALLSVRQLNIRSKSAVFRAKLSSAPELLMSANSMSAKGSSSAETENRPCNRSTCLSVIAQTTEQPYSATFGSHFPAHLAD